MESALPDLQARAVLPLTDHLLEEILVRIGAPADLARVSAACKAFRRLTTDPAFLRRYRSLHPPLLLGFVSYQRFVAAEAPRPEAPAARAVARAIDFSTEQLPDRGPRGWFRCDLRDGRELLMSAVYEGRPVLPALAVRDPLARVYTLLPPVPGNLLATILDEAGDEHNHVFHAFFDSSGDFEEAQFRVICWTHCTGIAVVFVYSSVSGIWSLGTTANWDALGFNIEPGDILGPDVRWPNHAYGCSYWLLLIKNKLLKFDIKRMEFSIVGIPPIHQNQIVVVVEAGEGKVGMCSLDYAKPLHFSVIQNEEDNDEHPVETTVPLPVNYSCFLAGAVAGYISVMGLARNSKVESGIFLLEIKKLKIEKVCSASTFDSFSLPYFGFPPSMSPRRI